MNRKLLKKAYLKAESPRKAFYILKLEKIRDGFIVSKESGADRKVLHKESWFRETLEEAEKLFRRILLQKTNPSRKSPRKYKIINLLDFSVNRYPP